MNIEENSGIPTVNHGAVVLKMSKTCAAYNVNLEEVLLAMENEDFDRAADLCKESTPDLSDMFDFSDDWQIGAKLHADVDACLVTSSNGSKCMISFVNSPIGKFVSCRLFEDYTINDTAYDLKATKEENNKFGERCNQVLFEYLEDIPLPLLQGLPRELYCKLNEVHCD